MSYVRVARDSTRRGAEAGWGTLLRRCSTCICRAKSWAVALHSRHEAQQKEEGENLYMGKL